MKSIGFLTFLLVTIFVTNVLAQKPVRGSLFSYSSNVSKDQSKSVIDEEPDKRFSDTVTIAIGSRTDAESASNDYEKAVELYQNKQYGEACNIFMRLGKTLPLKNQLRPDVQFMNAECAAVSGALDDAKKILAVLIEDKETPRQVLEKSLVRMGHVYCGLGEAPKAAEYFTRLKQEFPNSAYLRVASCSAIE